MKRLLHVLSVTVILHGSLHAGDIVANPGNVIANNGHVYATYNVQGTNLIAYSYLSTGTFAAVGTYATVGEFLRVGGATNAPATQSVQIGLNAITDSFNSLVVGRYNLNKAKDGTTAPNATAWNANDPVFAVGNGTGNGADPVAIRNRNAFTVYKDGTVTMSQAQGDILMGQFGN